MIRRDHPLLPIANKCLHYYSKSRPSSEEPCQSLADLKASREYRESVESYIDEIQAKDNQILSQVQHLQEKDRLLQQKENEIATQTQQLNDKETQLQQLQKQLEEQEQVTAKIQQTNYSLQRQVEQLKQQLSQQSPKSPQSPPPSQAQIRGRQLQEREPLKQLPEQPSLKVDCNPHPHRIRKIALGMMRNMGRAPLEMSRGAAVVSGSVAYFMNWRGEVCWYNLTYKKWRKVSHCPYKYGSLAVINGHLTTIGGCYDASNEDTYTNKLLSLPDYKEIFPPMPTKRREIIAVSSKEHLIVAGGTTGASTFCNITTVEAMDTKNLIWSTVASLPHPYSRVSGTLCGNQLHMLGGWDDKGTSTKSVLTCSLTELLQSSSSSSSIWHRVTDAPAYFSTCVAVNWELLE